MDTRGKSTLSRQQQLLRLQQQQAQLQMAQHQLQQQQQMQQHHPHPGQQQLYQGVSDESDMENETVGQRIRMDNLVDNVEDHIYNQYEKIGDRSSANSTGSSALSNPQNQQQQQQQQQLSQSTSGRNPGLPHQSSVSSSSVGGGGDRDRATHYAESAIYKRSRAGYPSPVDSDTSYGVQQVNPMPTIGRMVNGRTATLGHHQTLDRNNLLLEGVGGKISNKLLGSNLHLLSSSSTVSPHEQMASGPLIDPSVRGLNGMDYDGNATTCLVRTQSGSRFIPTSGGMIGSGSTMNPILIGQGFNQHTMNSKMGPVGPIYPSSVGGSFSMNSFQSRLGKRMSSVSCSWKVASLTLLLVSLALVGTLVFMLLNNNPQSTSWSEGTTPCSSNTFTSDDSTQVARTSSSSTSDGVISSTSSCPIVCSGRGIYLKGVCNCPSGWKGRECHVLSQDCEDNCSNQGQCVSGVCECNPGFSGSFCQEESCPLLCSGRGRYVKGSCICNSGWKGVECQVREDECEVSDCGGNGDCVDGQCHCNPGWKGPSCKEVDCLAPKCSGHGICINGMCLCGKGWKGPDCGTEDSMGRQCLPDCSSHGTFDLDSQRCICQTGYSGPDCSLEQCAMDCGRNGQCHDGRCICRDGFTGPKCQDVLCDSRCLEHGQCRNGSCVCHVGWNGRHCTLEGCPRNCNGHGECVQEEGDFECKCHPNWTGADCNVPLERDCSDERDNDNDGLIDCADSECCGSKECQNSPLCFSSADPLDILLRKQPPSPTASFFQRMQFLIEEDSVQSYANKPSFNDSRASVIRGQVVSPSGSGLVGIRVGVANDPLLGFVISRDGGWFDIMVNGGSAVTLHFQREPFIPTERTAMVPWNEIILLDKVTMKLEESRNQESELVKHPVCMDHDYDAMKPMVTPSWKNPSCSSNGLLSDSEVLPESLYVPGTELSLVYNSTRASGYHSLIEINLTPEKVPSSLRSVHLRITIEGNDFEKTFEADPSVSFTYGWNKRNIYRQKVFGVANAVVHIGYEYLSCPNIIWETRSVQVPGYDMSISEIGGWNLNIHHRYNFHEGILHKGEGTNIYLKQRPKIMTTVIGDGEQRPLHCPYCKGHSKEQRLLAPMALAASSDGSIFIGDFNLIRRLTVEGEVYTIVELSASQVAYKYHLAVGPTDNKLYISDPERHQIVKVINSVDPSDITKNLEVIAGSGVKCLPGDKHHCGDNRPAKEARLSYPKGLAVSLTNEVYVSDGTNVRFIDTSGIIRTLIGDHHHKSYWKPFPCSGSLPISKVNLRWPTELAFNPLDNSLHVLDDHVILKVTTDKRLVVVAGRPTHCNGVITAQEEIITTSERDMMRATSVFLETPTAITFTPLGQLIISESDSQMTNRIRMVHSSGRISRLAGADNKCSCLETGCDCLSQDNGLALNGKLSTISSLAVASNGDILVCDEGNLRIRSIKPFLPQANSNGEYEIISQENMEVYVFNKHGLHTATKSVLTGKFIYNFTYIMNTSFGKLSSITDTTGNKVDLLRDYSNQVKEMETSAGIKCRLEMSRTRMLESFLVGDSTDADKAVSFTYTGVTGLIKSRKESGGRLFVFEYDHNGRLVTALKPDKTPMTCHQ